MPAESGKKQKPEMAWSTLPLVERPLTSLVVLLFIALILTGIYFWFHSYYWVVLAGITLFVSLSAYFVPTHYELYDDHMVIKRFLTTQNKKWAEFKRLYSDRNGAFLSPFDSPNRLENFRGVFLRIPHNRVETFRFLQSKVPSSAADKTVEASSGDKA